MLNAPTAVPALPPPSRHPGSGHRAPIQGAASAARRVFFIAITYWDWKLDKRLFTSSSLALWASGLLKTRFWIWSDTLLMAMYAMLRPDSRSDAFFSTKS
jgi:hypothetical protein